MKTSLAYIDDVLDRAIETEEAAPKIPEKERESAHKKARKIIGGFRVYDGDAERKALDEMTEKRRKVLEQFRTDRTAVRDKLVKLGITPLAVCPTAAWFAICKQTGLFVLAPNAKGQVGVAAGAFKEFTGKSADKNIDAYAKAHWADALKLMFPEGVDQPSSHAKATLILPDPPADVADILCKAQSLSLKVGAVAEAISFAEKPSEIAKAANTNPKDPWAQQQGYADYADWVKRDPIIFTEQDTAVAIIAQFGEFPIEKQVVDAVVASDQLVSEKVRPIESLGPFDAAVMYQQSMMDYMRQAQGDYARQQERMLREGEMIRAQMPYRGF